MQTYRQSLNFISSAIFVFYAHTIVETCGLTKHLLLHLLASLIHNGREPLHRAACQGVARVQLQDLG